MATIPDDVKRRTEKSIKKHFYVALQYPLASDEEMTARLGDHLDYLSQYEDKIFLSGPFVRDGATVDIGLTVLKTADETEARQVMDAEPLIKLGLRRYELHLWRVQEGAPTVTISGIDGTGSIS